MIREKTIDQSPMKVLFNSVYIKPFSHSRDDCHLAYFESLTENRGIVSWWQQHNDGDNFMFVDVLVCEDIKVLFILDYYGFNFHSWDDWLECSPKNNHNHWMTLEWLGEIHTILHKWYPNYKIYNYNKGLFHRYRESKLRDLWNQVSTLTSRLPKDVLEKVYYSMIPEWVYYRHQLCNTRWNLSKFHRDTYSEAIELFYRDWDSFKAFVEKIDASSLIEREYITKMTRVIMD